MALPSKYLNASLGPVEGFDESKELIDQALAIWQPRAKRALTSEDGREIVENITGFFRVLQEWDRLERDAAQIRKQES